MFPVHVEKTAEQKTGHDTRVGISTTGDVITGFGRNLSKFSLQQDGSYSKQWECQLPKYLSSVSENYRKYLTETGDVILQYSMLSSTTFLLNQDMKLKDSWQQKGRLIGCLPGPRTVYAVKESNRNHIELRRQNGELIQLNSEINPWNSLRMSVCEDGRTGKLVVVSHDRQYMDIFSGDGKTKQRIRHQIIMQV